MATLDDKLLGEKLHYYCSSSEDEGGESGDEDGGRGEAGAPAKEPVTRFHPATEPGQHNTGPKGVLTDWRRYKQLETERREEAEVEKLALAKKLCLNARTGAEDDKAKADEAKLEAEMDALMDDDFLESYMSRRMQEMMAGANQAKKFGAVVELRDADAFLMQIEGEDKTVTVVIMIYEPGAEGCAAMAGCIECLAADYRTVKFCRILSTAAGLSKHFKAEGVPALLVYKADQLVGRFVRMTDQLGTDFFAPDVESVLCEHGLLPDREAVPTRIRGPAGGEESDTSLE